MKMLQERANKHKGYRNMKLKLKNTSGESVTLMIKPNDTFIDLRERVADELGLRLDLSDIVNGEHYLETQRVLDFFSQLPHAGDDTLVSGCLSNVECIVPGCNKKKNTHPENSFFEFPSEEIRNHQWALYCQRLLGESGKKRLNVTPNSRICSDHFKPEQFVKNAATILKKTAVPCINPEVSSKLQNPNSQSLFAEFNDSSSNILSSCSLDISPSNDFDSSSLIQIKKDKKPLCRLCAKYTSNYIYIFDDTDENFSLIRKINSCLPLDIDLEDPLPKQICTQCCLNLEKCYKFTESAVDAHLNLKERPTLDMAGLTVLAASKNNPDGSLDLSLMCDFSDEHQNILQNSCRLCFSGKMTHACLSFSGNSLITNYDIELEESDVSSDLSSRPNNDLTSCDLESLSVDSVLSVKPDDKSNCFKPLSNLNGEYSPEKVKFETKSCKQNTSDSWEAADNAFGYSCLLCSADFRSSSDLFPHSLMHSGNGHYVCCLCNHVCTNKNELAIHFTNHSVVASDMIYQCDNCGIGSRSFAMFEIHNCTSMNWTLNRCNICHKTFRSESRLKFHKKFHENGSKPGQCELCPKVFSDEIKLYKHVTYLHGYGKERKSHCCEECGKVFRSVGSLKYHQRVHQRESSLKPYSCDVCGKFFIRRSMLRNHITTIHKTLPVETECFMCKVCYELFPCQDAILIHLERMHTLISNESSYERFTSSKIYLCEFCKRCFRSSSHINSHRSKHRNDSPYECKHCLTEFSSCREMETHSITNHSDSLSKEYVIDFSTPVMFICEFCDRSFVSSLKYTEHLTVHYGPTPYLCRFCDEKFPSLEDLDSHRVSHADNECTSNETNYYRPYECHYCNKSFAIEDALIKHIRMHTGEKPFICDQCGKGFSQSSGLYTHQKVHSNDRPYTCSICPRRFKIKGDRDIHVRKHSGERPYKCEFCGKAFMTQHVYSQHRKIHTGERPYKCDVCHISFRRSHVLTVHKRIHTGEKPNSCDICGKRYRQKGDMLKHKRIQHGSARSVPSEVLLN